MARRSDRYRKLLAVVATAAATVAALAGGASASTTAPTRDQLLRALTDGVARRGFPVPKASYELVTGNWNGIPGRSWIDVINRRIYLSPEIERFAGEPSFPQGRREMRLQLYHELGHALDAELTNGDRGAYAAIMHDHRPWVAAHGDHVDVEEPPNERFAVAYAAVVARLPYDRLRRDYGFDPTPAQYKRLIRYFQALGARR